MTNKSLTNRPNFSRIILASSITQALFSSPVFALAEGVIEEVYVTARKREETLQEVPMAVSAMDGLKIEKAGINDVGDLYSRVPGLFYTLGGGATPNSDFTYLSMRGVGFNGGLEPAVGVFIDGMYQPQVGFDLGFLDLARVEVLRGPQGTLFGRNTQAGALNMVTRDPGERLEGLVEVEADEYEDYRVRAAVSGPLTDTLGGRLNLSLRDSEGWADNVTLNRKQNDAKGISARGKLVWTPQESLELELIGDYSDREFGDLGYGAPINCDCDDVLHDFQQDDEKKNIGLQLNVEWMLSNEITLTSLTGYRSVDSISFYDPDSNVSDQTPMTLDPVTESTTVPPVPIAVAPEPVTVAGTSHRTDLEQDFFSQEFRLSGGINEYTWLAGLYYFEQEMDQGRGFDIGPGIPFVPLYIRELFTEDRDGWALFGQASYEPSDRLELTLGARYSEEKVDVGGERVLNVANSSIFAFPKSGSEDYENVSGMASISYDINDTTLTYVTVAMGWKAGGINRFPSRENAVLPYDDETSINYEWGVKASSDDGRFVANAALYWIDIEDQQLLTVVPDPMGATPITTIDNAAASSSRGLELEVDMQFTEAMSLELTYAYTDTEFDDYLQKDAAGNVVDRSGDHFEYVPENTFAASASYLFQLNGKATLEAMLSYQYTDSFTSASGNFNAPLGFLNENDSQSRWDARAVWSNNSWTATVYVENLTDELDYSLVDYGAFLPLDQETLYGKPRQPRTFGVKVRYSF